MILTNKLNITNQLELNKAEEKISKQKAKKLFERLREDLDGHAYKIEIVPQILY